MNVIPITHVALVRARRDMEASFRCGDWSAVKDWDQFLTAQLNQAFDDPSRDHHLLAKELSSILSLYSEMVRTLPDDSSKEWLVCDLAD